jgi:hypothetical protein
MGVEKRRVARGEKISFSEGGGGGINIVFGPKYKPLLPVLYGSSIKTC